MSNFFQQNGELTLVKNPLVEENIRRLYPGLEIINPSRIVAQEVRAQLQRLGLESRGAGLGRNRFYASDLSDCFLRMIRSIMGERDMVVRRKSFDEGPD